MSTSIFGRLTDMVFRVKAQADTPAGKHGWFALPGGRLEYGASGFAIELCTQPSRLPYKLTDPEGRVIAFGGLLQTIKECGEQHARDRAEFLR
jgi:hypothetical protein